MTTMTMTLGGLRARRPRGDRTLNPRRIAAIAIVIALHVFAFGRMLMPTSPQFRAEQRSGEVEFQFIEDLPPPPPPPPPPPRLEEPPRIITPPPAQIVKPIELPPPVQPPPAFTAERGDEQAAPAVPLTPLPPALPARGSGGMLEKTRGGPPPYPQRELRLGVSGEARLRILVGIDGRAKTVEIVSTRGSPQFGVAAKRHVQRSWRFKPAVRDGQKVEAWGTVTIQFRL